MGNRMGFVFHRCPPSLAPRPLTFLSLLSLQVPVPLLRCRPGDGGVVYNCLLGRSIKLVFRDYKGEVVKQFRVRDCEGNRGTYRSKVLHEACPCILAACPLAARPPAPSSPARLTRVPADIARHRTSTQPNLISKLERAASKFRRR